MWICRPKKSTIHENQDKNESWWLGTKDYIIKTIPVILQYPHVLDQWNPDLQLSHKLKACKFLENESILRLKFQFITLLCFSYKVINKSSMTEKVNIFSVVYVVKEERNLTCN